MASAPGGAPPACGPPPTVTAVHPRRELRARDHGTINRTDLTGAIAVSSAPPAPAASRNSATSIKAVSPAEPVGDEVTVTTTWGAPPCHRRIGSAHAVVTCGGLSPKQSDSLRGGTERDGHGLRFALATRRPVHVRLRPGRPPRATAHHLRLSPRSPNSMKCDRDCSAIVVIEQPEDPTSYPFHLQLTLQSSRLGYNARDHQKPTRSTNEVRGRSEDCRVPAREVQVTVTIVYC